MLRLAIIWLFLIFCGMTIEGKSQYAIVADSVTHSPLPSASIFDKHGTLIGICNSKGLMPYISSTSYPITVRYLGFKEKLIINEGADTVFLQENPTKLPEVIIESPQHKVLHMLAYVRDYSTLTTYTDTVFLFREKMVDYMLNMNQTTRFRGWSTPRIIKTKSYYKFTNSQGLDSVSNVCSHHFSWSDWIGVMNTTKMPQKLNDIGCGTDTIYGKFSPTEVWIKNGDRVMVDVDVLADTISRKWVPNLSVFFHNNELEFDNFKIKFNYKDIITASVSPADLTGYSYNIESNGRGHSMFMFNHKDEPFFVSTYAEIYIIDKEYITVKEAKEWERHNFNLDDIEIYEPLEAPRLTPSIQTLVDRVDNIDIENIRSTLPPDSRLIGRLGVNHNFDIAHRFLNILKDLTGISSIRSHRKTNRQWNDFRKAQIHRNSARTTN